MPALGAPVLTVAPGHSGQLNLGVQRVPGEEVVMGVLGRPPSHGTGNTGAARHSDESVTPALVPPARTPPDAWRWTAVAGYMLAIFWSSSRSALPTLPGHPSDTRLHFVGYAVLSLLVIWASTRGRWRRTTGRVVLLATVICAAYGYSDEVHQRFVPGRQYDLRDLGADVLGGMTAGVAVWAWGIISRGSGQHDAV
jgi:VanZ family protein